MSLPVQQVSINQQKLSLNQTPMRPSPKKVAVDLAVENRKRNKSPSKNTVSPKPRDKFQFSFSKEGSPYVEPSERKKSTGKVSKRLFGSPQERKEAPVKIEEGNSTWAMTTSRNKERDGLYRGGIKNDRLFKRSVDKLKRTFFSDVRNNKQRTVKTLKEIGKYAKSRADDPRYREREEQRLEVAERKRTKDIPVQFYGCDPDSTESGYKAPLSLLQNARLAESKSSYNTRPVVCERKQTADKGTYFNFERDFKEQLRKTEQHLKSSICASVSPSLLQVQPKPSQSQIQPKKWDKSSSAWPSPFPSPLPSEPQSFDSINQIEIDSICQVFQLCEKYDQTDQLTQSSFVQLLKQLQRLYFIRVIQQSNSGSSRTTLREFESGFSELLRQFQDCFKLVFYRKERCDVYDCLYYLNEGGKLDRVCALFLGIRGMLQL